MEATTRERIVKVWNDNFLFSAPSYFVGALVAAAAISLMQMDKAWLLPSAFAPLYLTYRSYKVYLSRIEAEHRRVTEMADLHLATVELGVGRIDAVFAQTLGVVERGLLELRLVTRGGTVFLVLAAAGREPENGDAEESCHCC